MSKEELKIKKINDILNCDKDLQEYIIKIENDDKIPYDKTIEKKVLTKIRKKEFKKVDKAIVYLKVAGFTLFTLLLWNIGFSNINMQSFDNQNSTKDTIYSICNNISSVTAQINTFLFTPINIEEGEII